MKTAFYSSTSLYILTLFCVLVSFTKVHAQDEIIIDNYTELGVDEGSYPTYKSITIKDNGVLKVLKSGMRVDSFILIEPGGKIAGGYIRMIKNAEFINNSGVDAVDSTRISLFGGISIKGDFPTVLQGILVGWNNRPLDVFNDLTILDTCYFGTGGPTYNSPVNMHGHTLTLGKNAYFKGLGSSSFINPGAGGKVVKMLHPDSVNIIPIGDNGLKKKVSVKMNIPGDVLETSSVTLELFDVAHPNSIGLATQDYISRYFTYAFTDVTSPDATFSYKYSTIDVNGDSSMYKSAHWNGVEWQYQDSVDELNYTCYYNVTDVNGSLSAGRYLGLDTAPCENPDGLLVSEVSFHTAQLHWNPVNGASGYQLRYKSAETGWIYPPVTSDTTLIIDALTDSTQYFWSVYTDCEGSTFEDTSLYAPESSFVTAWDNKCYAPDVPQLQSLTNNSAVIYWNDPYVATDSFEVVFSDGITETTDFYPDTIITLNNLMPEQDYEIRIKTICSADSISYNYSPVLSFTTLSDCQSATHLNAEVTGIGSARITWSVPNDVETTTLQYKSVGASEWIEITEIADTFYTLSALEEYAEYMVQVKAVCTLTGSSMYTDAIEFRTWKVCDVVPGSPTLLSNASNGARISWEMVAGITAYEVHYRKEGDTDWVSKTTQTNTTNIVSLEALTEYEWKVRTFCAGTETNSEFTDVQSFTTLSPDAPKLGVGFNPISAFYGNMHGYPAWTDSIKWENVIDMGSYTNGDNNFEKFENARDELYVQGGGVLYYPGGTYDFSDRPTGPAGRGLMLKKGVVIVGEAPEQDKYAVKSNEEPGLGALATKFVFPFVERIDVDGETAYTPDVWNCIGIVPDESNGERLKDVTHVGIAWIDLDGAYVYMGPDMDWGVVYGTSEGWLTPLLKMEPQNWLSRTPDGTFFMDPWAGSPLSGKKYYKTDGRRFIFGCRLNNAALTNDVVDYGFGPDGYAGGFRFGARITVYGSNVFVANNAIPMSDKNFIYSQLTIDKKNGGTEALRNLMFDYGNGIGIDINKQLVSQCDNRTNFETGPFYEENVVILDNWVYNHGNKGYEFSGKEVIVKGNVNYRHFLGVDYANPNGDNVYGLGTNWHLSRTGYSVSMENSPDFLSRAFDYGGMNGWIDNNWYTGTGTALPANDGEGILLQRHTGSENFSWAITRNSQGTTGKEAYMGPYDAHTIGLLEAWNIQRGSVGLHNPKGSYGYDISLFKNFQLDGETPSEEFGLSGENVDSASFIDECPDVAPEAPSNLTVSANEHNSGIYITWDDMAENELGFRIDRRLSSGSEWTTVVYRPMEMKSTETIFTYNGKDAYGNSPPLFGDPVTMDFNKQEWTDYMAPKGEALEYRVIALDCSESEGTAGEISDPVILPVKVSQPRFSIASGDFSEPVTIEIFCSTAGADIYYTLDGSEPSLDSQMYTGPIALNATTTIRAKAFKGDNYPSEIAEAVYTITGMNGFTYSGGLIRAWPNPANDYCRIEVTNNYQGNYMLHVRDLSGKLILSAQAKKSGTVSSYLLPTRDLQQGVYLVEVLMNGSRYNIKLIK